MAPNKRFALKQIETVLLQWRYNDISTEEAWNRIGKIHIQVQKEEWADSHSSDISTFFPGEKD